MKRDGRDLSFYIGGLVMGFIGGFILCATASHAQSTYFTGPLGEPRGQAWSSGNQTNVTSQIGVPLGSAVNLTGGAPPVGVAITPLPQPQPIERIQPLQTIQPLGR